MDRSSRYLEIKNKIAKKNGFKDWKELQDEWLKRTKMSNLIHESYIDQILELYEQSGEHSSYS